MGQTLHKGRQGFGAKGAVRALALRHALAIFFALWFQPVPYGSTKPRKPRSGRRTTQHHTLEQAGRGTADARSQTTRHKRVLEHG